MKTNNLKSFIAIDPGINGTTGYAIFSEGINKNPLVTGQVEIKKFRQIAWEDRCFKTALEIGHIIDICKVKRAIIELPEFWGGSARSYMSTARGDIFKLAHLVGCLSYQAYLNKCLVKLITPRKWKGQLSKASLEAQIKCILGTTYDTEHIIDSVGIGLNEKGLI